MIILSGSGVRPGTEGGGAAVVWPGAVVVDGGGATLVWPGAVVEGGGEPFVWAGVVLEEGGVSPNGVRVEPGAGAVVFDEAGGVMVKGCWGATGGRTSSFVAGDTAGAAVGALVDPGGAGEAVRVGGTVVRGGATGCCWGVGAGGL